MKTLLKAAFGMALAATAATVGAQTPWLHVYYPQGQNYKQFAMPSVLDITFDEELGIMTVNLDGESPYSIVQSQIDCFTIGPNVPTLHINTTVPVDEITVKEVYLDGTLEFDGQGIFDDFTSPVQIRGRGNSTWGYSKKPYRLKFPAKTKLGNLKKAKNYALLANYIDEAMMRNFVAFKVEELLGMPYVNHALPVDVYLNGNYKGSYMATEKVGINNGSVDLTKEDEAKSIMFEFDTNQPTEDEFPFDSEYFNYDYGAYLPVRIKDPDAPVDPVEQSAWLEKWQNDLAGFMRAIESGSETEIFNACDLESLVRFIITFNVCCNQELDHPKSVFVYKTEGGKYTFGPCWDFDWAFGYQPTYVKGVNSNIWGWGWDETLYPSYENPLIGIGHTEGDSGSDGYGGLFFLSLCNNPTFLNRYKEVWDDFYQNRLTEFWQAFDEYAAMLKPSANLQGQYRSRYQNYDANVEALRAWVHNRIEYINTDPYYGLWEESTVSK